MRTTIQIKRLVAFNRQHSAASSLIVVLFLFFTVSCSSSAYLSNTDDVYGNVPTREQEIQAARKQAAQNRQSYEQTVYAEQDADVSIPQDDGQAAGGYYDTDEITEEVNTSADNTTDSQADFNYDDYYDYEYTSRIRHQHHCNGGDFTLQLYTQYIH